MPTTGIISGALFRLQMNGEKVVHATSASLDISMATTELSSKDTGGSGTWTEVTPDTLSFTGSCEALFSQDTTINAEARITYEGLFDTMAGQTPMVAKFTTDVTGDVEYSGLVYITALNASFPEDGPATVSFTITGDGALAKGTIG
jgi:hypothetical protein